MSFQERTWIWTWFTQILVWCLNRYTVLALVLFLQCHFVCSVVSFKHATHYLRFQLTGGEHICMDQVWVIYPWTGMCFPLRWVITFSPKPSFDKSFKWLPPSWARNWVPSACLSSVTLISAATLKPYYTSRSNDEQRGKFFGGLQELTVFIYDLFSLSSKKCQAAMSVWLTLLQGKLAGFWSRMAYWRWQHKVPCRIIPAMNEYLRWGLSLY